MGIASLVLGTISIVIGLIPFCGVIAVVPAIIGIILGIIDLVKKSKEGKTKGLSIAGIVLSSFAVVFIIFWVVVLASDTTTNNTINNNIANKKVENNQKNSVLYIGNTVKDPEVTNDNRENETNKTEKKESYSVGEVFNDGYMKVVYTALNDNFTDYSKYATIKEGCKVICASFEFENVSNGDESASSSDFECYADGYSCDSFYSVDDSSFYNRLSAGKKTKGNVYFQVPVNAEKIIIEYENNMWSSKKVKFIVK